MEKDHSSFPYNPSSGNHLLYKNPIKSINVKRFMGFKKLNQTRGLDKGIVFMKVHIDLKMSTNHGPTSNTSSAEQQRLRGRASRRIMKEVGDMMNEEGEREFARCGIYSHVEESNIYDFYAMLVGGEDTPYANGFYFFKFTFPENYPMSPPKGVSMTQGRVQTTECESVAIRFNPNLYTCGKLCLSILGTWQGPGWSPTSTIAIVCNSIQGMVLHGSPLKNEPAYYDSPESDPRVLNYSKTVAYANFKVAILDMLESRPAPVFDVFLPKMREIFLSRFDKIMSDLQRERSSAPATLRDECYGMGTIVMDYATVEQRMLAMRERLMGEGEGDTPPPPSPSQEEA
jgi:ubiquitin-protein ligase